MSQNTNHKPHKLQAHKRATDINLIKINQYTIETPSSISMNSETNEREIFEFCKEQLATQITKLETDRELIFKTHPIFQKFILSCIPEVKYDSKFSQACVTKCFIKLSKFKYYESLKQSLQNFKFNFDANEKEESKLICMNRLKAEIIHALNRKHIKAIDNSSLKFEDSFSLIDIPHPK